MESQKTVAQNYVKLVRDKSSLLGDCIKIEEATDSVKLYAGIVLERKKSVSASEAINRRCISQERVAQLKKMVDDAIANQKVFVIHGGFATVRRALTARGWCEKPASSAFRTDWVSQSDQQTSLDDLVHNLPSLLDGESQEAHIRKCEKAIQYRLLQHHDANFYWNVRREGCDWLQNVPRKAILNRFNRSRFTSKEGLCAILQQMHWFNEPGVAFTQFPRCYNSSFPEQLLAFIDDYRLTACMSLLKNFLHVYETEGALAVRSCAGTLPISTVEFAIKRCNEFVAATKHEDLDVDTTQIWEHEWENFLTNYYLFVHKKRRFLDQKNMVLTNIHVEASAALNNICPHWPQFTIDGSWNIWIVKPGNKCRGRGIHLMNNFQEIINLVSRTPVKKCRYVVQKYLEKPLLIHDCKFDIRQWFLVTSAQPLVLWMYRDSYLRFSSQQFELNNFHESVHLTNHSVQCKYKNGLRDSALPDENMWDCHTFKTYLKQTGSDGEWEQTIYPGMRQAIVGAMLASQDNMDRRANSFELYGADFMLGPDYMPWLLEINSSPDMAPTTSVTARLCPQCLEDIIKVTIDRRHDPNADTGLFDCIYKQSCPRPTAYLGLNLTVRGKKLFQRKPIPVRNEVTDALLELCGEPRAQTAPALNQYHYCGPVIGDLIEELTAQAKLSDAGFQIIQRTEPFPQKRVNTVHHSKATVQFQSASKSVSMLTQKLTQKSLSSSQKKDSKSGDSSKLTLKTSKQNSVGNAPKTKQSKTENRTDGLINDLKNKTYSSIRAVPKTQKEFERHTASILQSRAIFHENQDMSKLIKRKSDPKMLQTIYHRGTKPHIPSDVLQNFLAVGLRLKALENDDLRQKIVPKNIPKILVPNRKSAVK